MKIDLAQYEGRHGIVLKIPNGSNAAAKKIAKSIFNSGFCSSEVETIFREEDIWFFIWPDGVSVKMPDIMARAEQAKMLGIPLAIETFSNYIKNHAEKTSNPQ